MLSYNYNIQRLVVLCSEKGNARSLSKVDDGCILCILVYQGKVQKNATSSKNVEEKVM